MTRIRFEDLPSAKTPINAENLNKLNNVIVSREEPATGEEVWLQKGENLFDYKNVEYFPAFINTSTGIWDVAYEDSYGYKSTIIKVKPNTTYTISKRIGKTFRIATFTNYPEYYGTYNETWANHTGTEISITTGANDNYLVILCFANYNGDTGTYLDMYSTVQIERGEVATPYESYITKKIYTKIDNGVYEEFYCEENIVDLIYPIGSIYISVNGVNPSNLFGGAWEQLKDRFLLGAGDTYSGGNVGGEASHILTIDEMPSHNHTPTSNVRNITASSNITNTSYKGSTITAGDVIASNVGTYWEGMSTNSVGGGKAHNNMPPYLVVYMWKRIS